jgi:hypothetical protein
MSSHK